MTESQSLLTAATSVLTDQPQNRSFQQFKTQSCQSWTTYRGHLHAAMLSSLTQDHPPMLLSQRPARLPHHLMVALGTSTLPQILYCSYRAYRPWIILQIKSSALCSLAP